jgi:hypothetical protein
MVHNNIQHVHAFFQILSFFARRRESLDPTHHQWDRNRGGESKEMKEDRWYIEYNNRDYENYIICAVPVTARARWNYH